MDSCLLIRAEDPQQSLWGSAHRTFGLERTKQGTLAVVTKYTAAAKNNQGNPDRLRPAMVNTVFRLNRGVRGLKARGKWGAQSQVA